MVTRVQESLEGLGISEDPALKISYVKEPRRGAKASAADALSLDPNLPSLSQCSAQEPAGNQALARTRTNTHTHTPSFCEPSSYRRCPYPSSSHKIILRAGLFRPAWNSRPQPEVSFQGTPCYCLAYMFQSGHVAPFTTPWLTSRGCLGQALSSATGFVLNCACRGSYTNHTG